MMKMTTTMADEDNIDDVADEATVPELAWESARPDNAPQFNKSDSKDRHDDNYNDDEKTQRCMNEKLIAIPELMT